VVDDQSMTELDTVVVGGGLAGLVAAATAGAAGRRVLVLDPRPPGGRARCDRRDGFVLNRGPRALYLGGPGRQALEHLGLDVSAGAPPPTEGSSVVVGGRPHRAPDGPVGLARTTALTMREKVAFGRTLARVPGLDTSTLTGVSVTSWLDDLGLGGTPRLLAEAYLRLATYVHAPDLLDAGAAVANLQLALGAGVRYLDGGWQSIVDALVALGAFEVQTLEARSITPATTTSSVEVTTTAGPLRARSVVVATGTPAAAAALLGANAPELGGLGPVVTAACLELGLRRRPDRSFLIGGDEATYLSTHAPAARLAPPGHALVHVLRYHPVGTAGDTSADDDRAALWRTAEAAGVARDDVVVERFLARMVVSGSVPTAASGGLAGRPSVAHDTRPGVLLAGDWVGPRGLLADAAIDSGHEAGRLAGVRSGTMSVP
jgi:phytoene dehydrogenase-like protein